MRLLLGWAINAGVLLLLPYLLPAVQVRDFWTALLVALVLGLLNDDSTDVGRVHAGLVYRVELPCDAEAAARRVAVGETGKMAGGFTHRVEFGRVWQTDAPFETWSSLLVRAGVVGTFGAPR